MDNKVQIIAYANRFGGTIKELTNLLRNQFSKVYAGVHILPFYFPSNGADAGFDPINHTQVDPELGSWTDIEELSKTHEIMCDTIVNHMSWKSPQFQDVVSKGEKSPFYEMFLTMSSIFPSGATEDDLTSIYRPRPGLPFSVYSLGGKTRLVWTTFTSQQVDIDVTSKKGWEYLISILDLQSRSHVSAIRLDAVGYAIKEQGTSDFMTPSTFDFIDKFTKAAHTRGLEVLIEVHSYYLKQIQIAQKVDRVYDFALPPLLLHALIAGEVGPLAKWIGIRPNNAITVLDTHDGIGVIDVGSDQMNRSSKGLLRDSEVDALVETIHKNTHDESRQATGKAASNLDLYQINSTYYSALGNDNEKYLAARAVQFFLPGIPQVYYVGAMMSSNDMQLLEKTKVGRDINRHWYTHEAINNNLKRPEVQALNKLCMFRNELSAFNGTFSYEHNEKDQELTLRWGDEHTSAELIFAPSITAKHGELPRKVGSSHIKLIWRDGGGEHQTDNLLENPPYVSLNREETNVQR